MATVKKLATIESTIASPGQARIAFVKSIKFGGIGLDKSTVAVDRNLLAKAQETKAKLEIEVTIGQFVLTHTKDFFVIGANFDLCQRAKGTEENVVSIAATFSAKFNLTKAAEPDLVNAFAALEARLIFFPYLRHYVSDISYRMAIDPIVLPMTSEYDK
jgi:hypothetical protein